MSGHDLYLVLRERLEAVADTINIDSHILAESQQARGFSNERIARELYISEKTWRRWKTAGGIPAARLADVEKVLNLDIERPVRQRVVLADDLVTEPASDEVLARLARVESLLQDVLRRLPGEQDEPQEDSGG